MSRHGKVQSINRDLQPIPSRKRRLTVLIALWALALIGTTSWPAKLGFVLSTAAVFGTWRRFRVSPKSLNVERISICSHSASPVNSALEPRSASNERNEFRSTFWFNDEADRRVLAWQGNSQTLYEQNLDILKQISKLPITMR